MTRKLFLFISRLLAALLGVVGRSPSICSSSLPVAKRPWLLKILRFCAPLTQLRGFDSACGKARTATKGICYPSVRIVEFTSLQRVRQLLYIQKALGAPLVEFLKYFFRSESADVYDVLFIWADIFELGMQFPHNFIVKGYVPLFGPAQRFVQRYTQNHIHYRDVESEQLVRHDRQEPRANNSI